ncbi:hypothetical protein OGM23_06835 [Dickeya fangzhongdai]|uniref:hypothetical protein n=1 Tax=Dickeya TaxID=204037 RepID=UPI001268C3E5|nr:hypothetical protein [Dickeya sp. NCPPB 3274]WPD77053.1 hypothetical protein OGM23_06835 [Dickeya fangzhongdai]
MKLALSDKILTTDSSKIFLAIIKFFIPLYHKLPSHCRACPGIFYLRAYCGTLPAFSVDETHPLSIKRRNCGKNTPLSDSATIVIQQ